MQKPIARPAFSLLHATARLPHGWCDAAAEWADKCDHPENCEYLLVIDFRDRERRPNVSCWRERIWIQQLVNLDRPCTVDAWNLAARVSTGSILVEIADDWYPCDHWDTRILDLLNGDVNQEAVVWPSCEFQPRLITHPIITRAYYERPGRGGCAGELLYPEYISVGSDDDFTEYALRDSVVRGLPYYFEHRHRFNGMAPDDAVYRHTNRQEAWDVKDRVLARRRKDGFSK